jgi:hypothetical protein
MGVVVLRLASVDGFEESLSADAGAENRIE